MTNYPKRLALKKARYKNASSLMVFSQMRSEMKLYHDLHPVGRKLYKEELVESAVCDQIWASHIQVKFTMLLGSFKFVCVLVSESFIMGSLEFQI